MYTELIGWSAAAILLLTVGRQVFTQWRDRTCAGLSRWLFVGQLAASTGFVVYSWLVGNWVFVVTNVLMLATAGIGQWLFLQNKRREKLTDASAKFVNGSASMICLKIFKNSDTYEYPTGCQIRSGESVKMFRYLVPKDRETISACACSQPRKCCRLGALFDATLYGKSRPEFLTACSPTSERDKC